MSYVRKLAATIVAVLAVSPAIADGVVQKLITPADRTRLENYAKTRQIALSEARSGGDPAEFSRLEEALDKPLKPFTGFDMTGNWQCRTTKVGGLLPLVVYDWFKCRVTDDGSGWKLEKISGSQRTTGRFYDESAKRLIYLGTGYVNNDKPQPYASGPDTDQVGYAFRTGAKEWRVEFPAPRYESKLDILEFRR